MFVANLKIFFAILRKQGLFTAINVLGLATGIASCLLISLYVLDEFSYDSQHPAAARIVRISSFLAGVEQERTPIPSASPLAGPLLQQNFPEIEDYTRIAQEPVYLSVGNRGYHEESVRFVDAGFFSFFQFEWLDGDPVTALATPDSIVLTESMALKYFGAEDPLGRQLQLPQGGLLTVTGLIRDLQRTHLRADAFASMSTLVNLTEPAVLQSWFGARFQVYVRLRQGTSFEQLQPVLHEFLRNSMPPAARALYEPNSTPLLDIHLSEPQFLGLNGDSRHTEVLALMLVCVALLTIACINFVNLATARSGERGKEIAMRKVMGARRGQIFLQHMGESVWLVTCALLLGLGMAELALPALNAFSGKHLQLELAMLLLAFVGLGCVVALLAGAWPALYLSAFRPLAVLRPGFGSQRRAGLLRDALVILQFSIAIMLIIATWVIHQQVQYGKNIALGFDKDNVLVIGNPLGASWSVLKQRWLALPGVNAVSGAMNPPFKPIATSISARPEGGAAEGEILAFFMVDFDYFELFDVRFMAGRAFAEDFGGDRQMQPTASTPHTSAALVINRAMADKLDWAPADAIGRHIELNWSEDYSLSVVGQVVGVSDNMHVDSLRREVVPLLYMVPGSVAGLGYALVKVADADLSLTLQKIDAIWNEVYPDQPINRYFLQTQFQQIYATEEAQISLLAIFATLAITISCLGLFGLAAFTAHKRCKEVGIRKTFGGSSWAIVQLLTVDFSKLVLISNVIAWPIAWLAMSRWLEQFAYRIDLTPLVFVGSGLIALCIAWVTVGSTAARAASARPVLALRYE